MGFKKREPKQQKRRATAEKNRRVYRKKEQKPRKGRRNLTELKN